MLGRKAYAVSAEGTICDENVEDCANEAGGSVGIRRNIPKEK